MTTVLQPTADERKPRRPHRATVHPQILDLARSLAAIDPTLLAELAPRR